MQNLLDRAEVCRWFGGTKPLNARRSIGVSARADFPNLSVLVAPAVGFAMSAKLPCRRWLRGGSHEH